MTDPDATVSSRPRYTLRLPPAPSGRAKNHCHSTGPITEYGPRAPQYPRPGNQVRQHALIADSAQKIKGSVLETIKRPLNALWAQSPWFWVILLLAVALRLWIATYNTDANDSHLEVIQRIMMHGALPTAGDCWQCYHVKAFHYPAAVLLARLSIDNPLDQLLLLQYGNVVLGVVTLLLLWSWLNRRSLADRWKLILFAVVSLNPRFAAINTQVTNDSLVIFAATACFLCYAGFLDSKRFAYLWGALVFCALALATKASGIVVAVLIFGHLLVLALVHIRRLPRMKPEIAKTVLVVFIAFAPVPFSGYMQNYSQEGSPLASNIERLPVPDWSEDNWWSKAGTTSIVNTYFTFRWPELVAYPYIIKGPVLYPKHRTNHWAQIYGRHAFSRFTRWPASWATNGYWTTRVGQASMVLGLAPLALLVVGIGSLLLAAAGTVRTSRSVKPLVTDPEIFLASTFAIMIAMSLMLSLDFQTYRIMKAIYLYPGLIGALALLARGAAAVLWKLPAGGAGFLRHLLVCLVAVHVLDLAILGTDLHTRYSERVLRLATPEPPPDLGPGRVRLDKLEPAVEQVSGTVRTNESFSGLDLTGGYRKFRFGFGTHALSFMAFKLDKEYASFETSMALADESHSSDGVQFEIWGDSRLLYRSPKMIDHQLATVAVAVSGVDILALKVQPLGSSYGDHANWLHPVLTEKP